MPEWFASSAARLDLLSHWHYFADEVGSPELADHLTAQARLTFSKLARTPGLGRPSSLQHVRLAGFRQWRVDGFPKLLIFYRERAGVVEIARVIHGARDLESALSGPPPPTAED